MLSQTMQLHKSESNWISSIVKASVIQEQPHKTSWDLSPALEHTQCMTGSLIAQLAYGTWSKCFFFVTA